MPAFARKGHRLYTTGYVQEIFPKIYDVSSDFRREQMLARARDSIRYFRAHPEEVPNIAH